MNGHLFGIWFGQFLAVLPGLLARLLPAWLLCFVVLLYGFRAVKVRLRPRLLRLDDRVRAWAEGLRYRQADGVEAQNERGERVALTWFFRFWTNLASGPSLSFWSLAVPLWQFARGGRDFNATKMWLLPGLCFLLAMALSHFLKRIFKRLRPPRKAGAFGHAMKDHSFPSGHSLTALCFWTMLIIAWAASGANVLQVLCGVLVALIVVALTGLSRVYMGVHFPSDILGGYTIGAAWCITCYCALRPVLW